MSDPIHWDDFESGDVSRWAGETDLGGNLDIHTTAYQGTYGLRINVSGTAAYLTDTISPDAAVKHIRFKLKLPAINVVPQAVYFRPVVTTNATNCRLYIRKNPAAFWECYLESHGTNSGAYVQATAALTDDSWQDIDLRLTTAASGIDSNVTWNGTEVVAITPANSNASDSLRFGNDGAGNWGEYLYMDNLQIHDGIETSDYFNPPDDSVKGLAARASNTRTGVRNPLNH